MVAFLMLGIIPGTNIEINFVDWAVFMSLLFTVLIAYSAQKKQLPLVLLVTLTIRRSTRRFSRLALPA